MFGILVLSQDKLDELTEVGAKVSDRLRHVLLATGPIKTEAVALREELFHIKNTKDKYTDSDKVQHFEARGGPPVRCK